MLHVLPVMPVLERVGPYWLETAETGYNQIQIVSNWTHRSLNALRYPLHHFVPRQAIGGFRLERSHVHAASRVVPQIGTMLE